MIFPVSCTAISKTVCAAGSTYSHRQQSPFCYKQLGNSI
jgi:hypothetical protein